MSECSAIATFLAGRKLSRIGIDSETSSSSTVAERVSISVRSTSKSSGVSRTGVPARAPDRVLHRLLHVEVERVAELVRLVVVRVLVAGAGAFDLVTAGAVLHQLAVEVGERLVADGADRARGELEPARAAR